MSEFDTRPADTASADNYEAPQIEVTVSKAELEREVHYAGTLTDN